MTHEEVSAWRSFFSLFAGLGVERISSCSGIKPQLISAVGIKLGVQFDSIDIGKPQNGTESQHIIKSYGSIRTNAEIAEMLSTSRQRAHQLLVEAGFGGVRVRSRRSQARNAVVTAWIKSRDKVPRSQDIMQYFGFSHRKTLIIAKNINIKLDASRKIDDETRKHICAQYTDNVSLGAIAVNAGISVNYVCSIAREEGLPYRRNPRLRSKKIDGQSEAGRILQFMKTRKTVTPNAISRALGIDIRNVYTILCALRRKGLSKRHERGIYSLNK